MIFTRMDTASRKAKARCFQGCLSVLLAAGLIFGCSAPKPLTLMPTPVVYQNAAVDPFGHLTLEHRTTITHVFYATNRAPRTLDKELNYGNMRDSAIHLGEAAVRMGDPKTEWEDLLASSLGPPPLVPVPLTLESVSEAARIPLDPAPLDDRLTPGQQKFFDAINTALDRAVDKEIMVYVHGTKVDFANAAILTAEIDHFAGRDFVGVAFSWPSHQNILLYLTGIDVRRALNSSPALKRLLMLLADHTRAEHINLLAYSAGGKVASKALFELRRTFPDLDADALRTRFRLGSAAVAAADVEVDVFLERLPAISTLAEQVVITITDDDNALKAAKRFMGGKVRAGDQAGEGLEEVFIVDHHLSNVEIIDVSYGKEVRGFNISGHHYWYRHPWMSSDIVFLMRTDLPPHRRGLSPTELEGIWYLSPDYPEKIQNAAKTELKGKW